MTQSLVEGLTKLIDDEVEGPKFREYLTTIRTEEHYDFLKEVSEYLNQTNPKKRNNKASKIYESYTSPQALYPVNIPYYIADTITQYMTALSPHDEVSIDLFNEAREYILKLLALDSYMAYANKDEEDKNYSGKKEKTRRKRSRSEAKKRARSVTRNEEFSKGASGEKRCKSGRENGKKESLTSSQDVAQKEIFDNFILIYSNKPLLQEFEQFLKRSHSLEYLRFYQEIIRYHNLGTASKEEKKKIVLEIQQQFKIGSSAIICLDDYSVVRFMKNLENNKLDGIFSFFYQDVEAVLITKFLEFVNEKNGH
jgi:hypothetical protein